MGTAIVVAACGLLGLVVGPFVNLAIARVPARQPVLAEGTCGVCGASQGRWPTLLARCRSCQGSVPVRASLVTAATVALFTAVAARLGADWALPGFLLLSAVLLAVAVIDLEHLIVPNRIVVPALAVSVPLLGLAALAEGDWGPFGTAVAGALAGSIGLFLVHLVHPEGMGMGDVKLALVLGLFLGWFGLDHVALGLFLGFLLGALVGAVLVVLRLRKGSDHVPFAPFLAAGTMLAVLAGNPILDWYLG